MGRWMRFSEGGASRDPAPKVVTGESIVDESPQSRIWLPWRKLRAGSNLEGSIIGKALYAGRFSLPEALQATKRFD
jgi:hypothetical protein